MLLQCRRIVSELRAEERFHCGADAIHDRCQVRRLVLARARELLNRGSYCAAAGMAEYDHEACSEALRGELDTADLRGSHDVAGDPNHEEIAQPLVENNFGRHTRIGASEHDGERALS